MFLYGIPSRHLVKANTYTPIHADVSSHGRQSSADGVPVDGLVDGLIGGDDVQDEGLRELGDEILGAFVRKDLKG